MLKFSKKHLFMIFLLLLIGTPAGLNYSGFCMAEGRWLSDEEKIRVVAQAIANNGTNVNVLNEYMRSIESKDINNFINYELLYSPYYDKKLWRKNADGSYVRIATANVEDFLRANPDCCKITRSHSITSSHDTVQVVYTAQLVEVSTGKVISFKNYKEDYFVSPCGKVSVSYNY